MIINGNDKLMITSCNITGTDDYRYLQFYKLDFKIAKRNTSVNLYLPRYDATTPERIQLNKKRHLSPSLSQTRTNSNFLSIFKLHSIFRRSILLAPVDRWPRIVTLIGRLTPSPDNTELLILRPVPYVYYHKVYFKRVEFTVNWLWDCYCSAARRLLWKLVKVTILPLRPKILLNLIHTHTHAYFKNLLC